MTKIPAQWFILNSRLKSEGDSITLTLFSGPAAGPLVLPPAASIPPTTVPNSWSSSSPLGSLESALFTSELCWMQTALTLHPHCAHLSPEDQRAFCRDPPFPSHPLPIQQPERSFELECPIHAAARTECSSLVTTVPSSLVCWQTQKGKFHVCSLIVGLKHWSRGEWSEALLIAGDREGQGGVGGRGKAWEETPRRSHTEGGSSGFLWAA